MRRGSPRTPGHLKKIKKKPWNILKNFGNPQVCRLWRRRTPNNPEDPSNTSLKSWIWDQHLPEHMKWKFGESLEPRN